MKSEMVGILVSHGCGAGWSSLNDVDPANKELIESFERGDSDEEKIKIAERIYPDAYHGGLLKCRVHYVEKGTIYRIEEHNGNESIEFNYDSSWGVA